MLNGKTKKYLVILIVLAVILIGLIIAFIAVYKKGDNSDKKTAREPIETYSKQETESESDTDSQKDTTTDSTSEENTSEQSTPDAAETDSTQAPTTEQAVEPTTQESSVTPGNWDVSTLSTDTVPYGNSPDDTTAAGIPSGVFWYKNKWGQYNADFISEMGVKYNNGETTEKVIYLTMDCGFDNPETAVILDILKEKDVKATFFVTSMFYDARHDLIERMINEGHRIGGHTINHYDMTTLSVEQQTTEIMDVVNKLKSDFNYDCKLFRFPTGNFSDQCLAVVDNLGLKSVFWSYAYNDYSSTQPEVQPSYERAVKYLHPGAIYLLHASSSTNRAFIGDWIDAARNAGYTFGGVYPID